MDLGRTSISICCFFFVYLKLLIVFKIIVKLEYHGFCYYLVIGPWKLQIIFTLFNVRNASMISYVYCKQFDMHVIS